MIIPLSRGGGGLFKLRNSRERGLFERRAYKKLAILLEAGLVVPGSTYQKELRNVLKYQKNEINYMELDVGVIMQKNILKNL